MKNKTLKPYIISAFYSWSLDINETPLLEIKYPDNIYNLPLSLIDNKETIILNIDKNSIQNLVFSKNFIEFETTFINKKYQLNFSYDNIIRIFNKSDLYGLEFNGNSLIGNEMITEDFKSTTNHTSKLTLLKGGNN